MTLAPQVDRPKAIAALADLAAIPEGERYPHLMPDGTRVLAWREAENWCANYLHRSVRTVQRAFAGFRSRGEEAFQRNSRSDRGTSRFFRNHSEAANFAAYIRLAYAATFLAVHRAITANSDLLELSAGVSPSYETVRMWLKCTAQSDLVRSALEGQNTYRSAVASYFRLGVADARKARSRKNDV